MKLDDAEYYFLNFTADLPNEAGGIPIAFFLQWAATARVLTDEAQADFEGYRSTGRTALDFLFDHCDGKLYLGGFASEVEKFVRDYYGRDYTEDYVRAFDLKDASYDALCAVPFDEISQSKLDAVLNQRLSAFRALPLEQQRVPPKPTTQSARDGLERLLLPEALRDGFVLAPELKKFEEDVVLVRRHGTIDQLLKYSVYSGSNNEDGFHIGFHILFGGERLRRAWLDLMDARYREAPPREFTKPYHVYGYQEIYAEESHCYQTYREAMNPGMSGFWKRFEGRIDRHEQVHAACYRELIRSRLATVDSYAGLAAMAQTELQWARVRNGNVPATELLARCVLLVAYTDCLRSDDPDDARGMLIRQRAKGLYSAADAFPSMDEFERLIEALLQPGMAEKIRRDLDA